MRRATTLLAGFLLLAACESNLTASAPQLAVDLRGYMDQLKEWEPREKTIFQALSDVERTYYVDDDFVARRFKSALPDIQIHLAAISDFQARTPDVQQVHGRYVEGWREMGQGFRAVIAAMEGHDYQRLATAKSQVEAARRKLLQAFGQLDTLLAEVAPELERLRRSESAVSS